MSSSSPEPELAMIVEFTAAPGKREELRRELLALVTPTRAEEGCRLYDLHEDKENPDCFAFYEVWRSVAAHAAHDQTPHVNHIRKVLPELVASKPRKVLLRKLEPSAA